MTENQYQSQIDSLTQQLTEVSGELSLVYQTSAAARITRQPREFFRQSCLDLIDCLNVRAVGVVAAGESTLYGNLRIPASKLAKLADVMLDHVSVEHKALVQNGLDNSDLHWARPHISHVLAVPMRREDRFFGVMFAFNKSDGPFTTSDIKLLSAIANQAAVFLENSLLFADMKSLVLGLMRSLTSAVDAKDPYTRGHSERVAQLAQLIAEACGIDEETTQRIYLAGLLHDVGKIGVPETVLKKPGKLSDEEFEQMKAHPRIGEKIIADIPQLADLLPGVLHHHERFDGKGYPAKLHGDEIPLMARILCLADALDAMTSDRTYRPRMQMSHALDEIEKHAGTQFDPHLVDKLRLIPQQHLTPVLKLAA